MITLPGYDIRSKVFENHQTRVYRGIRQSDGEPTIIKILNKQYPLSEEVARFTRQHDLLQLVSHPNIVQSLGTEHYENAPALVMRDIGAVALTSIILDAAKPLGIKPFLELAIQLAGGLAAIHAARILHKDICPNNIIVTNDFRTAQIIDVSISSRLSREQAPNLTPHQLEGTLAYIAPEQTGRMNRVIDARSDLYSLGATFYTMLTGETLFPAHDPVELVHSHIARVPKRVDEVNPAVSTAVSDIIAALLRKNPEDRIQTALGLKLDLETCLEALQNGTPLKDFQPGKNDMVSELRIPQKLYGRGAQVQELLSSFERAATQKPEIMLVSGYSGIGKTALVNEIHKPIMRERGYFTQGKFDQFTRTVPYSALVSALDGLIRQILTEPEMQLQAWRTRLLEAVGVNGGIITDLVPKAALLLGSQPSVAETTDSQASQYRFQNVVLKFLQALSEEGQSLVMFLDDMQWADAATLSLVQQWMASPQTHHLLIICAYRDNEVSAAHPFMQMLGVLRERNISIQEIRVAALSAGDIAELLHDTVQITSEDDKNETIRLLAQEMLKKTGGNPFFVQQLLRTFYEREIIRFDTATHRWLWKHEDVVTADITENVVELVANTLKSMPSAMREILSFAACLGNSVEVDVLLKLCRSHFQYDTATMLDSLLQAIELGFLHIQQGQFNTLYNVRIGAESETTLENTVRCKFSHDRIQQAAYSMIDSQDLPKIHLFIGRFFVESGADSQSIFETVRHLNAGGEYIMEYSEKSVAAKLNVEAARQANTASAFASGYEYAQKAIEYVGEKGWRLDKSIMLQASEQAVLSAARMDMTDSVERVALLAQKHSQSVVELLPIEFYRVRFYRSKNNFPMALKLSEELIRSLGYSLPQMEKIGPLRMLTSFIRLELALKGKTIEDIQSAPIVSDEKKLAILKILGLLLITTFFSNRWAGLYAGFENLRLSLRYGVDEETISIWGMYCMMASVMGNIDKAYSYQRIIQYFGQRFGIATVSAKTSAIFAVFVMPWKQSLHEGISTLVEGYHHATDMGLVLEAATNLQAAQLYQFWTSNDLQAAVQTMSSYTETVGTMNEANHHQMMLARLQAAHNLLGEGEYAFVDEPARLEGELFHEAKQIQFYEEVKDRVSLQVLYFMKTMLAFLLGTKEESLRQTRILQQYQGAGFGGIMPVISQYFIALSCAQAYSVSAPIAEKIQFRRAITKAKNTLKKRAKNAPMNFLHNFYLVSAEEARVLKKYEEAEELYDKAIQSAEENKYLREQALANELAAKMYIERGRTRAAKAYMTEAYYLYTRWGSKAKTRQLESSFAEYIDKNSLASRPRTEGSLTTIATSIGSFSNSTSIGSFSNSTSINPSVLDIASLMKAAQSISGEVEVEKLLQTMMNVVMENAGADRACFLAKSGNQWLVQASASVGQNATIIAKMSSLPMQGNVPEAVINVVARTQELVLLADARTQSQFLRDTYIQERKPQSVLCLPLQNQGQLVGIFYLENSLAPNVFTPQRLEVLKLLSAQIAISLDNARSYELLEQKVAERTNELRIANEVLHANNIKLEELSNEKTEIMGIVSHDLKNPIGAVRGFADLIQNGFVEGDEEVRDISGQIVKTSERMLEMVQNLLDMNRFESGGVMVNAISLDINDFLEGILNEHRVVAGKKDITLHFTPSGGMPPVVADESMLVQIVDNLVSNAIKYSPHERNVFIRTVYQEGAGTVRLEIQDEGPGVSEKDMQKMFGKFARLSAQPTGGEHSTGLGLSIVKKIVEAMSGRVWCESELGKGATFFVELPHENHPQTV